MGITKAERYNKRPFGPKTNTQIVKLESQGSSGKTFDLIKMNLEDIAKELNHYLTKGEPITLWGRDRDNNKINLNTEKLRKLSSQLMAMRNMGEELAKFKASVLLHDDYINSIVGDYFTKFGRAAEIEKEQHTYNIKEIQQRARLLNIEEKALENRLEQQEATIDSIRAENEATRMKTQIDEMKAIAEVKLQEARKIKEIDLANGVKKILEDIDFKKLPSIYQTLIINYLYKPNDDTILKNVQQMIDANVAEKVQGAIIDQRNAEAIRSKIQAESETDHYKHNSKQFRDRMGDKN